MTGVKFLMAGGVFTVAQIPQPAPGGIEGWLLSGAAVLAIIYLGVRLWHEVRGKDREPPLERELASLAPVARVEIIERQLPSFALSKQLHDVEHEIEGKLVEMEHHLDQKREISIGKVHDELVQTKVKVAEVMAGQDGMRQALYALDAKMEKLPERIRDEHRSRRA